MTPLFPPSTTNLLLFDCARLSAQRPHRLVNIQFNLATSITDEAVLLFMQQDTPTKSSRLSASSPFRGSLMEERGTCGGKGVSWHASESQPLPPSPRHHTKWRGRDEASGPSTRGGRRTQSRRFRLPTVEPSDSNGVPPPPTGSCPGKELRAPHRGGPTAAKASQQPTIAAGNHGHPTRVVPRLLARLPPLLFLPPAQAFKARWRLPRRGLSREGIQQRTGKESLSAIPSSLSTSAQGPVPVNPSRFESLPLQSRLCAPPAFPPPLLLSRGAGGS